MENGYTQTITGWKSYHPDFWSPSRGVASHALRKAVNEYMQATAAGVVKLYMVGQDAVAQALGGTMLLQVHDETVCEVPNTVLYEFVRESRSALADAQVLKTVPLEIRIYTGDNWGRMKEYEDVTTNNS